MKTSSLHLVALVTGVLFIALSAYIYFSAPTTVKKEGFAAPKLPPKPPVKPAPKPALLPAAAATVAAAAAVAPVKAPSAPPLSKSDFEAQNARITNLTSALELKDNELKKSRADNQETQKVVEEKLETIKNLNERLDISEEVKNLTLKEIAATQQQLEIALAQRETSEINLKLTKLNLDDVVRKNLNLNQSAALTKRDTNQYDDRCMKTDRELLQIKQNLQRFSVDKKVSDDLVKQLKLQLEASRKNEPAAKKLAAELERADIQNKQITTQLEQAKTKSSALEKESAEQKKQLAELKDKTRRLELDKSVVQRELLISQGRYDTERLAKSASDQEVTRLEEKLASRDKISAGIEAQYKSLKQQCDMMEKRFALNKEQKSALQAGVDKQSAELAILREKPKASAPAKAAPAKAAPAKPKK